MIISLNKEKTKMAKIKDVVARQILDSRGNPTVEVDIILENGILGRASVASGASTGEYEVLELRDKGKEFLGKGVRTACRNVNEILGKKILGMEADQQEKVDNFLIELDGTENKEKLGANSILGISLAIAKASAKSLNLPLYRYLEERENYIIPVPMMNILNGGMHADNNLDIQEFMIVPLGAENFASAYRSAAETFQHLKNILKERNYSTGVGDEGGFAPNLQNNEEAFKLIGKAIEKAGYHGGSDICIAIDTAASSFFKDGKYIFEGGEKNAREMVDYYQEIIKKYPIISIEDGLAEDDWEGWRILTERLGEKIQLVGDDIFVTNPKRLKRGTEEKIANSILIKVNQIGTLTETLNTISLAKGNDYRTVISHRSGETEETFIADLAVATSAGQIKSGSLCRMERIAKYNQLLRIEEELGDNASFAGKEPYEKYLK